MEKIQAIRGMNDVLPDASPRWQYLERITRAVLAAWAYREIRFPVLEQTQLFKRSIGEVTDIVEKEMYTFEDRNGDSLSLRPEGTAGCVRASITSGTSPDSPMGGRTASNCAGRSRSSSSTTVSNQTAIWTTTRTSRISGRRE